MGDGGVGFPVHDRLSLRSRITYGGVELQILSVDYKYQRKGLGGRLIEWGTDELERRQVPSIIVATQAGYGLYMKSGFVTQDTWDEDLSRWGGSGSYMNAVLTRYPQETGKAEAKAAETD